MTQYGYAYLTPNRKNPNDDAAYNQTINRLGMDEIKPLMCPRSHGNTEVCLDECDGFRTCTVGQRAVKLSDEAAKKAEMAKIVELEPKDRELLKTACESGNAWNYLMETKKIGKDAAGDLLSRLIKKFPGIAADYGGSRRIMQRPRTVTITSGTTEKNAETSAPETRQEASGAKAEQESVRTAEGPENAEKTAKPEKHKGYRVSPEEARAFYNEYMAQDDPVGYYAEKRGVSRRSATASIKSYCRTHGLEIPPSAPRKKEAGEDDEISLSDFLTEMGATETDEPEPQAPGNMIDMLRTTKDQLQVEKAQLQEQIKKSEERIKCIEEQQEALARCLQAFGA